MPNSSTSKFCPQPLAGPFGAEIAKARVAIAKLAAAPIRLPGLPGALPYRPKQDFAKSKVARPAVVQSPGTLLSGRETQDEESYENCATGQSPTCSTDPVGSVSQQIEARALRMLSAEGARKPIWVFGKQPRRHTSHEFTSFRMMQEPDIIGGLMLESPAQANFHQAALDVIKDVIAALPPTKYESQLVPNIAIIESNYGERVQERSDLNLELVPDSYTIQLLLNYFYTLFLQYLAYELYVIHRHIPAGSQVSIIDYFRQWFSDLYTEYGWNEDSVVNSADAVRHWTNGAAQIEAAFLQANKGIKALIHAENEGMGYPFFPYDSSSIGFGLQLVYNHSWQLDSIRPGEIVKTIPLGPRQVQKVYSKVVTTNKFFTSSETSQSLETFSDSIQTGRTSHDVVQEASQSTKFNAGLDISAPVKAVSVGGSADLSLEAASASKDTKTSFNESVDKTSQRMRKDIKVVVTTERTSTTEESSAIELVNPNDEIPITYVYSALRSEYTVCARLREVRSVVFVPERIPGADEIDQEWIRQHDWILGKYLLDESLRGDLERTSGGDPSSADTAEATTLDWFKASGEEARSSLKAYNKYRGGSLADVFSNIHDSYERELTHVRESQVRRDHYNRSRDRICSHVRQNILHYMRQIWLHEDPQQRFLRYRGKMVCIGTNFVNDEPATPASWQQGVRGRFIPSLDPAHTLPLSDIADLGSPLGYHGNCVVFRLRSEPSVINAHTALSAFRSVYLAFNWSGHIRVQDSAKTDIFHVAVISPRFRRQTYSIAKNAQSGLWSASVASSGETVKIRQARGGAAVNVDGLYIQFSAVPAAGFEADITITAADTALDPEERNAPLSDPLPLAAEEALFWKDELLADIARLVPTVRQSIGQGAALKWATLAPEGRQKVRAAWYTYLVRRKHERHILLDNGNLILDLEVGTTVAMEQFKRLHRTVDVLKELETLTQKRLENERRAGRIAVGQLEDPDIEQMHVTQIDVDPKVTLPTPFPSPTP